MGSYELTQTFHDLQTKSLPVAADEVAIADSTDSGRVRKVPISLLFGTAVQLTELEVKATPTPADKVALQDAADDDAMKVSTVQSVFAASGLIAGLTAEAAPAAGDLVVINDISNSNAARKSTVQQLVGTAGAISGQTAKAAPIPADALLINDSASGNAGKVSTLQQLFGAAGLVDGLTVDAAPSGSDLLVTNDVSNSNAARKVTVDSLPIAQAQVRKILLRPEANAAVEILPTTGGVELEITDATNTAITTNAGCYRGQQVSFRCKAASGGGSYTLDLGGGVNLTINATGEAPRVMRSETDTWVVMGLEGATIV